MHQFCYASQSTSTKTNLLDDLTNILAEARDFNHQHGVSGVLYFADGYFFQCLEGEKSILEKLIQKLDTDHRHDHIRLFEMYEIDQPSFQDWTMKYISRRDSIHAFCKALGFDAFTPLQFEQLHVHALLNELKTQHASELIEV